MTRIRIGLLIIRAWVEPGSSSPLRAQIRLTTDVTDGFESSLIVSQEDVAIPGDRLRRPSDFARTTTPSYLC